MSVRPIRAQHVDVVFEARASYLMDLLAQAQSELSTALLYTGDVEAGKAAARKLASIGWLFREAADKHEGSTMCACGHEADWHTQGGAGDCEHDPGCHCQTFTQHQTGPGASLLEDRGTGARKDTP